MPKGTDDKQEAYKVYVKTSAVGLEVGLSVVIGILGGYFVDRHFHLSPWGLIVGFVIGGVAAARRLFAFTKQYLKENRDDDDKSNQI